jgi:hypothetical protein
MNQRVLISVALGALALFAGPEAQAQSTYSNAVVGLNPVGYWPLNETVAPSPAGMYVATNLGSAQIAGNAYYETWWTNFGAGFSLTNVNNTAHAAGAIGNDSDTSMQCGGTGQYLVFPRATNGVANSAVTLQPPFSVEMWVWVHSVNSLREILVEGGNKVETGNTNAQEGIEMGLNTTHFYWKTYNGALGGVGGGTSLATPANAILSNTWHHVVLAFDGTVKNFYVDAMSHNAAIATT